MRFRKPFVLLAPLCFAALAPVQAQTPLNPAVPFVRTTGAALSAGAAAELLAAAQRAQALGFSSVAAENYRTLLAQPGADRANLTLALATVLLDAGLAAEAEKALAEPAAPRGAAWHLRAGLTALQLKKRDAAQAEWDGIKESEVTPADHPWYWFFTGALYDTAAVRDTTRANDFYHRAEAGAATDLARARFLLAEEQVRLELKPPSKADIENVFNNYQARQSSDLGYSFARSYAVMLDMDGRRSEAVTFLREVLLTLPPSERERQDDFRFLLGLIDNRGHGAAGRSALIQLLENGSDADKQLEALQLLSGASLSGVERDGFRNELERLIRVTPPHRVLDSLLLFRAQLALADKNTVLAWDTSERLLREYPGSRLRPYALAVQTASAWDRQSYRTAAASARRARDDLGTSTIGTAAERAEARGRLGVLEAEAWFRAGETGDTNDYRQAADAYKAVLDERPVGIPVGDLMLQRVLAEIRAGSNEGAERLLDELARDPAFDLTKETRWQAEWTLARELQIEGKTAEAYARVNAVLANTATGGPALPAELTVQMKWLQARLSFDTGRPDQTLSLLDKLTTAAGELAQPLKDEILSTSALLKAEANFQLGGDARDPKVAHDRETAAFEALAKLRKDYAGSDAAISSYFVEAHHYAKLNRIDEARKALKSLADDFPRSGYAPQALYQAALLAERLGQKSGYEEANGLLVDLVKKYPESDLVFYAQLREGGLLQKLLQQPLAQNVYQELVNKFPRHGDVTLAQLALAECINAQSSDNPAFLDIAKTKFEELRDRVDAPVDVRVEAGYNLGEILVRQGQESAAVGKWWNLVVMPFLENESSAAKLGPTGRYWMARTLMRTGEVDQKLEKLEEAKKAWTYILQKQLPGETLAKSNLVSVGVLDPKP